MLVGRRAPAASRRSRLAAVRRRTTRQLGLAALLIGALPAAASAAVVPELVPGPEIAGAEFSVRYTGSSSTETVYRGTPPNPRGGPDLNTAHDTGRTSWALDYSATLRIPVCATVDDPCAATIGVSRASGKLAASGVVRHRHIDGPYSELDSSANCTLKARGLPRKNILAQIDVLHDAARGAWVVRALNPVGDALNLMPQSCREPVDGIDRILGNYFWPSFSFSPNYVPDRWFTSEAVAIPDAVWRSSSRIRLRLGPQRVNKPPADCAKRYRYERCRTTGSWSGVLTFTRRAG